MAAHAYYRLDDSHNAHIVAQRMYQRAYRQGQLALLWSTLTRRPRHLVDLVEVASARTPRDGGSVRKQRVPIRQIRGSCGRCADFDADFHPLQQHNRERWLNIAVSRDRGASLPPVELIQVGEIYFVQDGHHRISVARARGQKAVDARVTVWDMAGPLPGESRNPPHDSPQVGGDKHSVL